MRKINIHWFRKDLRIHDNYILSSLNSYCQNSVFIYIIDESNYKKLNNGLIKTGPYRTKFLFETLLDLDKSLSKFNQKLYVYYGKTEEIFSSLYEELKFDSISYQADSNFEEVNIEKKVLSNLPNDISIKNYYDQTLIHPDDLPFKINQLDDIFTNFRKKVEKNLIIKDLYKVDSLPKPIELDYKIDWKSDFFNLEMKNQSPKSAIQFIGGESSAINRLNNYFYLTDNISRYKETRNGLLSADYSSKFSAWLANGSLSPRFIYWKLKEYEKERINNQSTYWLLFELLWRDYFKFVAMKYGKKIFFKSGLRKKTTEYSNDFNLFQKWINGDTNEKFVNANMIELKESGFMSNRGRQNVMSYLVHDLGIDWRWGAEYFESMLIDYDVESNWGNSQYIAGVGNDPRENRKFNIKRQQDMYDPENKYINYWLAKG